MQCRLLRCGLVFCVIAVGTISTAWSGQVPDPESIRQTASDVLSGPDYQLDKGLDESTRSWWQTVLSWILAPFIWLFEALNGLPLPIRIVVSIVLSVIAIALIIHIIWSLAVAIRGINKVVRAPVDTDEKTDPHQLEHSAADAAEQGSYLEAIRLLFRAALVRIEQSEKKRFRLGITNRELLRRYRRSPLGDPLSLLVEIVDRKWYGAEECDSADYAHCREQHASIRTLTKGNLHAVSS